MNVKTALNHQSRVYRQLNDLYSRASHFNLDFDAMQAERRKIFDSIAHCPQWVREYLRGAESVLTDNMYHRDLEYCSVVEGKLVSHHRNSERYYEKAGFTPEQVCKKNMDAGHYWKDTDKRFYPSP